MDTPPYYLELSNPEGPTRDPGALEAGGGPIRPWLGIRFDCCGAYTRVYRNREGTAYVGRCPKCLRPVRIVVGPGGTNARFFVAE